ncbi:lipase 1 [Anabrus simplex]|uniref:lipase 1 n=1 Tax=Anabrus simplex TaxID=316456 RepID=UPI0035A3211C
MVKRILLTSMMLALAEAMAGLKSIPHLIYQARMKSPELFLTATELSKKAGYEMETHVVRTEDGYLLTLHHLPPRPSLVSKGPVFFMHGLAHQTDMWIIQGPNHSLPYLLVDRGYDVWIGNCRGNLYSKTYAAAKNENPLYWDFSWHEIGYYDLPAFIDYVLVRTRHDSLLYVGFSMGGTTACVLLSTRPEYNAKIRLMVGLAPAVYAEHTRSPIARELIVLRDANRDTLGMLRAANMLSSSEARTALAYFTCRDGSSTQRICEETFYGIGGYSSALNKTMLPVYLNLLADVSTKTVLHFSQIETTGKFEQWDFGPEMNMNIYNSSRPPKYDLTKMTVPTELYTSKGDALIPSEDVELLMGILPNVIGFRLVQARDFSHLDFLTHMNVKKLVYDDVIATLERY